MICKTLKHTSTTHHLAPGLLLSEVQKIKSIPAAHTSSFQGKRFQHVKIPRCEYSSLLQWKIKHTIKAGTRFDTQYITKTTYIIKMKILCFTRFFLSTVTANQQRMAY